MSISRLAPIVLFTYNRPEHTRRTIEALAKNRLAGASELIVYSDGPKTAAAAAQVKEVRRYLRGVQDFYEMTIVERRENLGLANSIIEGVTHVCRLHGRVIVMEDDLISSECFLEYMNQALDHYAQHERVMHISGYMYPIETQGLPETYFLPPASCWGWATWERAWKYFGKDSQRLRSTFSATDRRRFNLDNSFPYWGQVEMNAQKRINTWAIFWYATVFEQQGLCLHPRLSYVQNIGHDNSGQHSEASKVFEVELNRSHVACWSADMDFNSTALRRLRSFFWATLPLRTRMKLLAASLGERLQRSRLIGDLL